MILKGSSRAGALDLALHLSNEIDNERVVVASVRGSTSKNLFETFREWELISGATNAAKGFYSLSINPDPRQRAWSDEEWETAIERIEAKLDLTGQPRAIVFHDKAGISDGNIRRHCHVVWSRTQVREHRLRTIPDSQDYYKLRAVSKELAKEFGLELRKGRRSGEAYDLAKSKGCNRDPEAASTRKNTITKLWQDYPEPKSFTVALHNAGYVIAQGDRRSFVVVDCDGQVHALPRQIDGVKVKQVKERLGDAREFPTVEQAKEEQRIINLTEERPKKQAAPKRVDLSREQKLMAKLKRMARRADRLRVERRQKLEALIEKTIIKHADEAAWRQRRFRAQTAKLITKRKRAEPKGLTKRLRTLIGYETLLKWKHKQQDIERQRAFNQHRKEMKKAQAKELERIKRQGPMIEKLERREAKSLERLSKKLRVSKEKLIQNHEREKQLRLLNEKRGQKIQFTR